MSKKRTFRTNTAGKRRGAKAAKAALGDFITAHEATRKDPGDMPRALLERQLAEWMLADKEAHTGQDFGARPRSDIPFAMFTEWRALKLNDGGPMRARSEAQQRATAAHVAREAAKCAELFRAVIWQLAIDLEPTWGTSPDDRKWAYSMFSAKSPYFVSRLDELSALSMIDPDALRSAYLAGRLNGLSRDAIGKRRWDTRRANNAARDAANPVSGKQMELAL